MVECLNIWGLSLLKAILWNCFFLSKKRPQSGEDTEVFKYLAEFFDTFNRESKKE